MNRLFSLVGGLGVALLVLASPPVAQACGDKLTVLGGGLPFDRIHTNHRHGSLILYLSPDSRLLATNGAAHLDQALMRDGHQVRRVQTSAELKQALNESQADFVLIDWTDARQLHPEVITGVPIVPVVYGASAEERAFAQSRSGCVVQSSKGHNRQFVRAVETFLEEKQSGLAASCSASLSATSG